MPFVELSSSQWTPFLETGLHDLYHLPEYAALEAEWMKGEPLGWLCAHDDCYCLIPLISRSIHSSALYDLISPYGYPGILPLKPLTAREASKALGTFQAEAAAAGYISSFIRLHPFLNNQSFLPAVSQCHHGTTLSIDLRSMKHSNTSGHRESANHLMNGFSLNHRRNLRQLHKEGYSTVINEWSYLSNFAEAYTATMIRRKAAPRYLFSEDYFSRLRCIAGEHLYFITVMSPEGAFCCGGLFSHFGRTMQYLFGATVKSAMHHSPSKLMMEEAINQGISNSAEILHLGGGVGAEVTDGVFRFKQGFAHQRHAFHCLHLIHRPEIYQQLEQSAGSSYTSPHYSNSCKAPSSSCVSKEQREALAENPPMIIVAEESSNYGENPRFFPSYRASDD